MTAQEAAEGALAGLADVLHVGDVFEHLTNLGHDVPIILAILRPGGVLVAQGPLQNGATAFNLVVRSVGRPRPNRRREQLPTHVTQSSRKGQLAFFDRAGLATEHFSQWEVWWPAAASLHEASGSRRALGLHLAKRLSRTLTRLTPLPMGDRYFFVGSAPSSPNPYECPRRPTVTRHTREPATSRSSTVSDTFSSRS